VHLHVYTTWRCILNEKILASIAGRRFVLFCFLTPGKSHCFASCDHSVLTGFSLLPWWLRLFGLKISFFGGDTIFLLPLIVATLGLTLDFVLWFYSLRFTTVAHATFIVNMAPLWVGVMSHRVLKGAHE